MLKALETNPLTLLPLGMDDAPALQRVFPQWEIVRWLVATIPWPYPDDGARSLLEHVVVPSHAAGTAWHWSIRRKEQPDVLIGSISLLEGEDQNRGFWLDPVWQGRGLMTEACATVTDFWFGALDKHMLRVPKAVGNPASRHISEKQGCVWCPTSNPGWSRASTRWRFGRSAATNGCATDRLAEQ